MSRSTEGSSHGNDGSSSAPRRLRSRDWFDNPAHADMSALYVERYTNFGISIEELQSARPIIGIAQTGSDLTPCNRHHLVLAQRLKEGIREAGGIPLEFPVHPIQETMGTATTLNSLTEVLGMSLPGSAAIPAPYRDRQECAWHTGKQIVEMVAAGRKPSDILTREAFINAIRVNSALGGSTNAPVHLNALARHMGVELSIDDWQTYGYDVPLLVNLQPAGEYLGEDYYRAGGVPAVVGELMRQGLIHEQALSALCWSLR